MVFKKYITILCLLIPLASIAIKCSDLDRHQLSEPIGALGCVFTERELALDNQETKRRLLAVVMDRYRGVLEEGPELLLVL